MSDIFVIHADNDRARAASIVEVLTAAGLNASATGDGSEKLCLALWSEESVDPARGVVDKAEAAKLRQAYIGVLVDKVELPFGFGGYQLIDIAPYRGAKGDPKLQSVVTAVKAALASGGAGVGALAPEIAKPVDKKSPALIAGIAVAVIAILGAVAWFVMRGSQPGPGEVIQAKLSAIPCAWLNIDPVDDGSAGRLGLIGVAGDPAQAGATIETLAKESKLSIEAVSIDKVAQIDARECAAIEQLRKLRKSPGGRLIVTGEPFILDSSLPKAQALTRVNIKLDADDKAMALFGVEPSGVVTWALPDVATLESLSTMDVGYVKSGDRSWEFNIYPDHLGWTGLFVVVGDRELAKKMPQGTVQSSRDFAATLREGTAQGKWDADMVWFRIDPK